LNTAYDIIGDIHGCAQSLTRLLERLGYRNISGVFRHESRTAIFVGDFIDRGPRQRATIELVRPMIVGGHALGVIGNHEFNAIAYHTYDEEHGDYLRRHTERNRRQHQAFLDEYGDTVDDYRDVVDWFKTLPLWLDLGGMRVVHACWDEAAMTRLAGLVTEGNCLTDRLVKDASTYGRQEFLDVETLLKGKEVPLADGHAIVDNDGHEWPNIRIRWWDQNATTYQRAFMGSPSAIAHIPDDEIKGDHLIDYSHKLPPVFLGHYWMDNTPTPLAENIAVLTTVSRRQAGGWWPTSGTESLC
jgi:hypothetical protein